MKLNARQLRDLDENPEIISGKKRNPIYFILDSIYDTYNIGGLFRLADALHIEKIYICGESETPPNHKIKKASIGTYKIVPWEYRNTVAEAIENIRKANTLSLRAQRSNLKRPTNKHIEIAASSDIRRPRNDKTDIQIIAIEQNKKAVPYTAFDYSFPLALILGNETTGVSTEALEVSDAIVEIPMHGVNKSLNVIVSAAIVGYHLLEKN